MSAPTGALAVLGRRRRVIEDGAAHEPRTSETAPWVTGVLAVVQAAIASLALLVLPAVIVTQTLVELVAQLAYIRLMPLVRGR